MEFMIVKTDADLTHHGVLGQKWGVRRYQNKDGSLTALGKRRASGADFDGDTVDEKGNVLVKSRADKIRDNEDLSYRVGEKRLNSRLSQIERKMTKTMSKRRNEERDEEIKENALLRQETEAALENPDRVRSVGRRTILTRTLASSAAAVASGASVVAALTVESAIPLAAVPVAAAVAGKKWLESRD